ncbi:flavodoxin family protein [Euzebya sp.]|uniref:flavodoxin family protein n=1 Tax=Euzebya sp. TaxID=1971409 RepID=UPI0035136D2F
MAPARILIVHHSPTASLEQIVAAATAGIEHPALGGAVAAVPRPALSATAEDVEDADGVVLVTPVNLGYMGGALKHFFDSTFRDLESAGTRRPYVAVVKGTTDAGGAVRAIESITTGLRWPAARPPVVVEGDVDDAFLARVTETCAELAASLAP